MEFHEHIALVGNGTVAITFDKPTMSTQKAKVSKDVTVVPPEMANNLGIAFWGGDNLYPQNVALQIENVSAARSILDFKAKALFGDGIVPGKIVGRDKDGYEIFEPIDISKPEYEAIDELFYDNDNFYRFYLEFNQDWVTFGNCFPRLRLSNDGKKVKYLIHEESADCRFEQMNEHGVIEKVYLSKYWAPIEHQFVKATQNDKLKDRAKKHTNLNSFDPELIRPVAAIDMYNQMESMKHLVLDKKERNLILPVNYPSTGKTYYQSPVWDALRLSGWLEIAANIPKMLQSLYAKAFKINYHIEIPETYFKLTVDNWQSLSPDEQKKKKEDFARSLDKFLSGPENSYRSMITFFQHDRTTGRDLSGIKITPIKNNVEIDKDILLTSVINQEIAFALQLNPAIIGSGAPGKSSPGSGSDIREAWLVFQAMLALERKIILEPLRLAARWNGAPRNIDFRFLNTKLTTLDQNSGTAKVLS